MRTPTLKQTMLSIAIVVSSLFVHAHGQTPANIEEAPSGMLTGKVVNESGQPLVGATVFVRTANSPATGRTASTDIDGNFRVHGLAPGLYSLSASAVAHAWPAPDPSAPPTYYRVGDSVRIDLVRGGVITGSITNAQGEPVIGVRVRAILVRNAKGAVPPTAVFAAFEQSTDDRGIYRIYGLAPGSYLVSAGGSSFSQPFQFNPYDTDSPTYAPSATRDDATEVVVRAGEESSADIRYRAEPGYTVSGTVKVAGTGGASVMLRPVSNQASVASASAFQGANNRGFSFTGVGDGDYDLYAQEVMMGQATTSMPNMAHSEVKRITVKGSSVSGIELITKPLPTISGRITLEPSKVPECQGKRKPLFAETLVRFNREENEGKKDSHLYVRSGSGSASPDANGAFVMRNLIPGKYQFESQFYARYWYLRSMTLGAAPVGTARTSSARTDVTTTWTAVKFGDQLTNLNVILAEGAASIRGRLTLAEGASVPAGLHVYLVPAEQEDVLRFFVTEIAPDGTFAFNNLAPGRYWSLTQTSTDSQLTTLRKLREPESALARTKLRRTAETQKAEIQLKPCQNLTDYQVKQQ